MEIYLCSFLVAINGVATYINLKNLKEADYPEKLLFAAVVTLNSTLALANIAFLMREVLKQGLVR